MKRYGNLWNDIVSKENFLSAYKNAKRNKSKKSYVIEFEKNWEENLEKIRQSLIDKTYIVSDYMLKTIYEPKERLIYKLPFAPDRIVQHALMNVIKPIWDRILIYDCYACRDGKGVHKGSKRTMEFVRKYKYCLKLDIRKFYPSINHEILKKIFRKKIKCENTLWLLDSIVDSIGGKTNTPIGNYTSQWFGNLYMNEMDNFVKRTLKCKAYLRYCDDFALFSNDKEYLKKCSIEIEKFAKEKLELVLSKNNICRTDQGIDFLGYRHFKKYILLKKRTAKSTVNKLKQLPRKLRRKKINTKDVENLMGSIIGWCCHANSYNYLKYNKIHEIKEAAHNNDKNKIKELIHERFSKES